MQAVILKEKNKITIEDFQAGETLGVDDVRIAIKNVGICGSDVHYFLHGNIGDFVVREPMVLGHEASGVILEVGSGVQHLKVGDRVCMEPGIPALGSPSTLAGRYNLDPEVRFWATPPYHGCMRESVVHPASFTFKLPDEVSLEEGALVEPLAIGVYSAHTAGIQPGDVALVFGSGTIGIVTALAALASGCSKVLLVDVKERKLEIVRQHFSENIICVNSARESLEDAVSALGPEGADIVFEASGNPRAFTDIFRIVRPGGAVVLVGLPVEPVVFDVPAAISREARIETVFRYANVFDRALNLIASAKVDLKPLITGTFAFDDSIQAFERAAKGLAPDVKLQIKVAGH